MRRGFRRWALGALALLAMSPACGHSPERAHHGAPARRPGEAVEGFDSRTPVPLLAPMAAHQLANMRDHLLAVQEIIAAIAREDFPSAGSAARRIGYSESMGQMCQHMGLGAPGFTEQALGFHHAADAIADAAARRDRSATLAALGTTLERCVGCHASFRQRVVDHAEWERVARTASVSRHSTGNAHDDVGH